MNIEEIKKQVRDVVSFSQGIDNPQVDELIDTWVKAKEKFITAFGGPIWRSDATIAFPLNEIEKDRKVEEFSSSLYNLYRDEDLYNFLDSNKSSFYENKVSKKFDISGKTIPEGMKIVKALKYFIKDESALDKVQSEASRIIQEGKIEGKLCLSVHPLDFLSSSENTYNWRSCHALDGDYRAGNLSYMTDSSTVICYLEGAEDVVLPAFGKTKWNSKKWRVLCFVSDDWDMVAVGRQYPFPSNEGAEVVSDILIQALKENKENFSRLTDYDVNPTPDCPSFFPTYVPIRNSLISKTDLIIDCKNPLHYNDLLYSSCYKMKYRYNKHYFKNAPKIHIGNMVKCLRCGKRYITESSTMMCNSCEYEYGTSENDLFAICDCCGCHMYRDEGTYVGDDFVCPQCVEQYCAICEHCGEIVYNENITYYEKTEEYLCDECYEDILEYESEEE